MSSRAVVISSLQFLQHLCPLTLGLFHRTLQGLHDIGAVGVLLQELPVAIFLWLHLRQHPLAGADPTLANPNVLGQLALP